ncbi:hypothetical protein WJX84_004223 [Apatococcus fuscideae]|uniref:Alpha-1,6-mannosyl-glycoprotein 6-beta-N-acetylglucosaminyltransferase n=1 Tax=Apatococcus fuscideae TaxID=2026836 RepID=A0AAW1SWC3_9CHLO
MTSCSQCATRSPFHEDPLAPHPQDMFLTSRFIRQQPWGIISREHFTLKADAVEECCSKRAAGCSNKASTRICPCTLLSVPNHQLLRVACMAPTMLRRLEPCGQNDLQQETACRVLQVCQPTFRGERYSMGS